MEVHQNLLFHDKKVEAEEHDTNRVENEEDAEEEAEQKYFLGLGRRRNVM